MSSVKKTENRKQIIPEKLTYAIANIQQMVDMRLAQKGSGTFSSRHETLGIVTEEWKELVDAVHDGTLDDVYTELLDIAVACVIGMACVSGKTVDW